MNQEKLLKNIIKHENEDIPQLRASLETIANDINERAINIKTLGCVGDGVFDNTSIIQKVIDDNEENGIKLIIPEGVFICNLMINSYIRIEGISRKSILKSKANATIPVISLKKDTSQMVELYNLTIDGNKLNQNIALDGVLLINTWDSEIMLSNSKIGEHDSRHYFNNLYIQNTKGNGLTVTGRGESQFIGVQTLHCDGNGIKSDAQDNRFINCSTGESGLEGIINTTKAPNVTFANCKSWFSGRINANNGDGYSLEGNRTVLLGCESQDNRKHGFVFSGKDITGTGLFSEANGWRMNQSDITLDSTGFMFYGAENCNIQGVACDRFTPNSKQSWGVRFLNNAKGNKIDLTSKGMLKGAILPSNLVGDNFYNITEITLNGELYNRSFGNSLSLNIVNDKTTSLYARSIKELGHTIGAISRFDSDETEGVVHRFEKYNINGEKARYDIMIDDTTNNMRIAPLDGGNWIQFDSIIRTKDSSWNGKHLMIGGYHLWIDSQNRLRLKSTTPTSEDDGIIVGSQT